MYCERPGSKTATHTIENKLKENGAFRDAQNSTFDRKPIYKQED